MKLLLLCEGAAEAWDSWSGISKSLVDHLRAAGHSVEVADIDVSGLDRWLAAAATIRTDRHRWATRYHLCATPFWLRSKRAGRRFAEQRGTVDAIIQIGATFELRHTGRVPSFVCCDSNICVAQQGASTGYSDASVLTVSEAASIAKREARVYRHASGIFPLSERLRRSFVTDFGIPPDRIRVIYAGPNFDLGRVPQSRSRSHTEPPTVLFVGRQYHRKGGDLLVESFRRVRERLPAARLMMAGLPAGSVVAPGIQCLGDLDKNTDDGWEALANAYCSADVFALPTRFEPFGVAFVEAMHFGLPCIGPQTGAVPEIITDADTGFIVPPEDVDSLTDRLLRLLTNTDLARRMGAAGRARAHDVFTWPHAVNRMLEVIGPQVDASKCVQDVPTHFERAEAEH